VLRFLADEDLRGAIFRGVQRKVPQADFVRVVDVGLSGAPDDAVLQWAASEDRVVVTHDVNTMLSVGFDRVAAGEPMPGIVAIPQSASIGQVVNDLILIVTCARDDDLRDQIVHLPW
jgi:hypothetical protein